MFARSLTHHAYIRIFAVSDQPEILPAHSFFSRSCCPCCVNVDRRRASIALAKPRARSAASPLSSEEFAPAAVVKARAASDTSDTSPHRTSWSDVKTRPEKSASRQDSAKQHVPTSSSVHKSKLTQGKQRPKSVMVTNLKSSSRVGQPRCTSMAVTSSEKHRKKLTKTEQEEKMAEKLTAAGWESKQTKDGRVFYFHRAQQRFVSYASLRAQYGIWLVWMVSFLPA